MIVVPYTRAAQLAAHRAAAQSVARVFERFFDDGFAARSEVRTPAIDVLETDGGYRIAFDVPGATRESLKATVEGRRLVLEPVASAAEATAAEGAPKTAQAPNADAAERTLYRERVTPRYARTVVLPVDVDAASAEAKLENGVLTLTVAKKQPAGKVEVRVA